METAFAHGCGIDLCHIDLCQTVGESDLIAVHRAAVRACPVLVNAAVLRVSNGFTQRDLTVKGIQNIIGDRDLKGRCFRFQSVCTGIEREHGLDTAHCIPVGVFVLRCGEDFAPGQTVCCGIGSVEVISRCRCIRCVHPFAVAEVVEHAAKFADQRTCISRCSRGSNGNGTVHRNRRAEDIFISHAGNGGGIRVHHTICVF